MDKSAGILVSCCSKKTTNVGTLKQHKFIILQEVRGLTQVFLFFFKVYFAERESKHISGREGQRESQADAMLSTEPNVGLDIMILRP